MGENVKKPADKWKHQHTRPNIMAKRRGRTPDERAEAKKERARARKEQRERAKSGTKRAAGRPKKTTATEGAPPTVGPEETQLAQKVAQRMASNARFPSVSGVARRKCGVDGTLWKALRDMGKLAMNLGLTDDQHQQVKLGHASADEVMQDPALANHIFNLNPTRLLWLQEKKREADEAWVDAEEVTKVEVAG